MIVVVLVAGIAAYELLGGGLGTGGQSNQSTHTIAVFGASAPVNASKYLSLNFTVPSGSTNVALIGSLVTGGGAGNDIKVYVLDSSNYANWKSGSQATYLYTTPAQAQFSVILTLPNGSGTYYVVFDNTYSSMDKTVSGQLTLSYSG